VIGNDDFLSFSRRIVAAAGRRASEDVEMLRDLADLGEHIDRAVRCAVDTLIHEHGYSWTDIGRVLGVSRQAAQQRFRNRTDSPQLDLGI